MASSTTNKREFNIDSIMTSQPSAPPSYDASISASQPINPDIMLEKQAKHQALCAKLDINPVFQSSLWSLNEKHIIFLCDDSGSMNSQVDNKFMSGSVGGVITRWDELKYVVTEVFEISLIFDPVGMDVHFLNRPSMLNVRSQTPILHAFGNPPSGGTPLVARLNSISQTYRNTDQYKYSKLLIIATDGEPTDDDPVYSGFKQVIRTLVEQGFNIAFLICTDREDQVKYINYVDRLYQQVDVTDDYLTEKKQVQNVQGRYFKFSYGDYIVKLLAGCIDPVLDGLDERRLPIRTTGGHTRHGPLGGCQIL